MISITLKGHEHLSKKTDEQYGDTFHWIAGPRIREFCSNNGLTCLMSHSSDDPNDFVFHFPDDRPDIAALFKLTFR